VLPFHVDAQRNPHLKKLFSRHASDSKLIIADALDITSPVTFTREVVIYPTALITTSGNGSITFSNRVTILGDLQVFDTDVNIAFAPNVIGELNPNWFGANGTDNADDTDALAKTLAVAKQLPNASCIHIPIGRYMLSKTLVLESANADKYPISLRGVSSSFTGASGSSLLWTGSSDQSMLLIRNLSNAVIENIDFNSILPKVAKQNIEMRPFINQILFSNCVFSGCAGPASVNVNLNEGNNAQVSEIHFDNCSFRGIAWNDLYTRNAVRGGWANTKDFYFRNSSFGPYKEHAIMIGSSDVLVVENCTFFSNDVDIFCSTCKSRLESNYSEASRAFFEGTSSANYNATTMINNNFNGEPAEGYVIRRGSGTLVLLNNNFGGGNATAFKNRVRWLDSKFGSITSIGNVYTNLGIRDDAFHDESGNPLKQIRVYSRDDRGGSLSERILLDAKGDLPVRLNNQ
jgi:uncharacterized protein YjbI with pentapeptide repeats